MGASKRQPHLKLQKEYFDQRVDTFLQPIPSSIQTRTESIVSSAGLAPDSRVLDVGTGVGVLIKHFIDQGVKAENIVGCDLSAKMLRQAANRFSSVFFWRGDIVDLSLPLPDDFPDHINCFDFVFFNACFGNMWDRKETLRSAISLLGTEEKQANGGLKKVVISHPLGAGFVDSLHRVEPQIVPHLLPAREELDEWSCSLGFEIVRFEDSPELYLAILNIGRGDDK